MAGQLPVSIVVTLYNEQDTVAEFLNSAAALVRWPRELVLVDGGSQDNTPAVMAEWQRANPGFPLRVISTGRKVNIAVGRNIGIERAETDAIAVSDCGCRFDPDWLERITAPLLAGRADVVAGWYLPRPENEFERAVGESFMLRQDEVDIRTFRPSSRSIAFTRAAWSEAGRYPEHLTLSAEDTLFVEQLRATGAKFEFAPGAVVYWRPWRSWRHVRKICWSMGRGDAEAGLDAKRYLARAVMVLCPVLLLAGKRRHRHLWLRFVATAYQVAGWASTKVRIGRHPLGVAR